MPLWKEAFVRMMQHNFPWEDRIHNAYVNYFQQLMTKEADKIGYKNLCCVIDNRLGSKMNQGARYLPVKELIGRTLNDKTSMYSKFILPFLYVCSFKDKSCKWVDQRELVYKNIDRAVQVKLDLLFESLNPEKANFKYIQVLNESKQAFDTDDLYELIAKGKELYGKLYLDPLPSQTERVPQEDVDGTINKTEQTLAPPSTPATIHIVEQFQQLRFCQPRYYVETKMDRGTLGSNIRDIYAGLYIEAINDIVKSCYASHFSGFMYLLYCTPCLKWLEIFQDASSYYSEWINSRLAKEGGQGVVFALRERYNELESEVQRLKEAKSEAEAEAKKLKERVDDKQFRKLREALDKTSQIEWKTFYKWSKEIFMYLFEVKDLGITIKDEAESQAKKNMYNIFCDEKQEINWINYLKEYNIYDEELHKKCVQYKKNADDNRKKKGRSRIKKVAFIENLDSQNAKENDDSVLSEDR